MLAYDERFYLEQHPDVAAAVARGEWPSGFTHYSVAGKARGRIGAPVVDEQWYTATYPVVREDIQRGRAATPTEHYHTIGMFRGYLPSRGARRMEDPARTRSRFGGLWTDHGNALDIVEGRLDIGQIRPAEADLLRKWITDGYVILPKAVPEAVIEAAERYLDRAYHGKVDGLRFAVHGRGENIAWVEEALSAPAKALDIHWHSPEVRDLIFAPAILEFLHLVFERRALASQTLGFWRGSAQDGHQDSAYVNYSLPMQFAASWVALEDVAEGAGELFYYVGSHRLPEFYYAGQFKGAEEAKRLDPKVDLSQDYPRHIDLIRMQASGLDLPKEKFMARRGDVLIWSADLAHGGSPISNAKTRKSIVTHYCPRDVTPAYFDYKPNRPLSSYGGKAFWSSSHYS